jgi:hypothetical protein
MKNSTPYMGDTKVAIRNFHRWDGLKHENVFSHISGVNI